MSTARSFVFMMEMLVEEDVMAHLDVAQVVGKVRKPRFASARLRFCTRKTKTTRINGMGSMGHLVQARSTRYICGLCCVR